MSVRFNINITFLWLVTLLSVALFIQGRCEAQQKTKPRIVVCSDIGGTDPDDFQSMIHLLMYADKFKVKGLISSPFGNGRKEHFLRMIDLYEKDLQKSWMLCKVSGLTLIIT
jgi:hypothetical protein